MPAFPITGRFVGDFVPHLVAVDTADTIDQVAKKVATHSVGHRVARRKDRPGYDVLLNDEVLSPTAMFGDVLAEHAVQPLQWFDVRFREQDAADV
jgi:hypothetical protein